MSTLKLFLIMAWLCFPAVSIADTFYVATSGNNSNPGTAAQPWRNISFAVTKVSPGDTVFVGDGIYREKVIITRSGTPDNYVVLKSINKWGAKVEVAESGQTDGIKIAANYITVDGFEIYDPNLNTASHGNCITVWENHHVNILNNRLHDCGGAGIQLGRFDHVLVENNVVYNNAKYNPVQSSGIGMFQARAVDDAPGYHIVIRNNRSYNNINLVLSGRPIGTSDGNGIIVDNFQNEGSTNVNYPHRTLIENNLSYNNGGKGLHLFKSDNVDVFNNTVYHNNTDTQNTGTWRAELSLVYSKNTVWRNNIGYANPGQGILAWNRGILIARSEDMIWENNISYSGSAGDISVNFSGTSVTEADLANNLLGVDPLFRNPGDADFTLRQNSPAIDAGSDLIVSFCDINYVARESGKVDIGAFERDGASATANDDKGMPNADEMPISSYPNPFSNRTEITYALSRPEVVRVEIFNSIGQHITTLVDAEQPAGTHAVSFDGNQLPNGLYYYRIVTPTTAQTRAVVLAK
ncbi:MAG: right-handed parallel beta-helix repeat-containing protein [Bacteroidota bacterium]